VCDTEVVAWVRTPTLQLARQFYTVATSMSCTSAKGLIALTESLKLLCIDSKVKERAA